MDNDISEVSVSSVGTDNSALSVLAKMMQDQAALVQAMASTNGNPNSNPAEVSELEREKQYLAEQVLALQQQLNATAGASAVGDERSFDSNMSDPRVGSFVGASSYGTSQLPSTYAGSQPTFGTSVPTYAEESFDARSVGSARSGRSGRSGRSARSRGVRNVNRVPSARGGASYVGSEVPLTVGSEFEQEDEFAEYRKAQSIVASNRPGAMPDVDDDDDSSIDSYRSNRSGRSARSNRSGGSYRSTRSGRSNCSKSIRSARSARSQRSKVSNAQRQKNGFEAPLQEFKRPENPPGSQAWRSMAFMCTFMVPDMCINRVGQGAKQAWREKVTICMIALLTSAAMVGGIGFLPIYFCRPSGLYTYQEIWKQQGEAWTTMFGTIYDMADYIDHHPGGRQGILDFLGNDASKLFPRLPPNQLPAFCLDITKTEYLSENQEPVCTLLDEIDRLTGVPCHDWLVGKREVQKYFEPYQTAKLVIPTWELGKNGMQWITIDKNIYNVTQYVDGLRHNKTGVINEDPAGPNAYLYKSLHLLIVNALNQDATELYHDLFDTSDFKMCLDELFFEARIDDRYDPTCHSIGVLMYIFLFFVVGMLAVQVMCSLLYLFRGHVTFTEEDTQAAVMIMVPCYNEGEGELKKTIDSCINTIYPEENKCMVIIADGVITGSGEKYSTPEICARLLDFEIDYEDDECYHYRSRGKKRDNYASVYTGTYECEVDEAERSLKYIVIVKRGAPEDRGTDRAGNRGKRDSQLIITGMLNRIHHNREPEELDMALVKALFSVGLPAKDIEYLMCIDADTRVHEHSINHMVYAMERDKKCLACCGETQVDNKAQSWVTMIQVFEYYSSHHLKKAFESVFGCVTCLPGCFTMYRIFTEDMQALIGDDQVFIDYSRNDIPSLHEKNLFELGEDRMLTTLLLQRFPGMNLSFVPEAICWTIVPHNMTILLSQRRRWINSTFHNMYELLKVQTMCGLCMFSMKTVVIMDLIVTMVLPASLIYVIYLAYLFISQPETVDQFVLIVYGTSFCLQMLSFLLRSRYDYIWWFIIFCIAGIPVFYFILPIYSFTHMDDFSWGKTRTVAAKEEEEREGDDEERSTSESSEGGNKSVYSRGKLGAANGPPSVAASRSQAPSQTGSKMEKSMEMRSYATDMASEGVNTYGTGMPSYGAQTYGSAMPSHAGETYGSGMPSFSGQTYGSSMPSQGGTFAGGYPPQSQGQPYNGQQPYHAPHSEYDNVSLGASTIQTNITRDFEVSLNQQGRRPDPMVAIPDGFSVGRGDEYDDGPQEPQPRGGRSGQYDAYRGFL